jgi:hypothetical protein
MSSYTRCRRRALAASAALLVSPFLSQTAFSQETGQPSGPTDGPDSKASESRAADIVVTGSHIRRPDFETASPTVAITPQLIQQSGTTNLTDYLTSIPALVGSMTSRDNSGTAPASAIPASTCSTCATWAPTARWFWSTDGVMCRAWKAALRSTSTRSPKT